jgi:hypothetical protein
LLAEQYITIIKTEGFRGKKEDTKKRKANTSVQNTSDFLIPEEPGGCFAEGWEYENDSCAIKTLF